jgi:glycerophosphoryl diester phosphodiesterase
LRAKGNAQILFSFYIKFGHYHMKFIAHRGYSKRFPENSLQAFGAVINHPQNGRSLMGIELDIHLTADGRIPVIHDTSVANSQGAPVAICDISFSQLQESFRAMHPERGHAVPDLNETLRLVSHKTELCLEIKKADYDIDRFTRTLIKSLEEYRPKGDVALSTFSAQILQYVISKTSHLNLRYGFLFDAWDTCDNLPADVRSAIHYMHPRFNLVLSHPDRIATLGLPVQCWTVDSPAVVQSILDLPCAGAVRSIMTNDIALSNQFPEP